MPKERVLKFGELEVKKGDFIEVLVSARKYAFFVDEINEYNQIIGHDVDGNPVMVKAGKISALRKVNSSGQPQ